MPLGFLHTHPGWGTGRQWGGRVLREPQLDAHRLWVPGGFAPQASRPLLGTLPGASSPPDTGASVVRAALVGWRTHAPEDWGPGARPLSGAPEDRDPGARPLSGAPEDRDPGARPLSGAPECPSCPRPAVSLSRFRRPHQPRRNDALPGAIIGAGRRVTGTESTGSWGGSLERRPVPARGLQATGGAPAWTPRLRI